MARPASAVHQASAVNDPEARALAAATEPAASAEPEAGVPSVEADPTVADSSVAWDRSVLDFRRQGPAGIRRLLLSSRTRCDAALGACDWATDLVTNVSLVSRVEPADLHQ